MPTLHSRRHMRGQDHPHGLTWANIETLREQPRRSPIAYALAGAFVSGALVGLLVAVVVVAVT